MRKAKGLTFIELMIVLVIVAISVSVGVPMMKSTVNGNRLSAQTNELLAALSLARSEAIKRATRVTVCRSSTAGATDNAATPTPSCATSGGWDAGWIVFVDDNGNGTVDATDGNGVRNASEPLVFARTGPLAGRNTLALAPASGTDTSRVTFTGDGITSNSTGAGVFTLCDFSRSRYGTQITINITGRAQVIKLAPPSNTTLC